MVRDVPTIGVEGPVTAEVFVVARTEEGVQLTGPCGPEPWLIEAVDSGHPMALVDRMARDNLDEVTLLHSTSWRYQDGQVVLSFVAVIPPDAIGDMGAVPVDRSELARGSAHEAPTDVAWAAVLEHGLRHLAWLVEDDEAVAAALDDGWHAVLEGYVPAPFQHLD